MVVENPQDEPDITADDEIKGNRNNSITIDLSDFSADVASLFTIKIAINIADRCSDANITFAITDIADHSNSANFNSDTDKAEPRLGRYRGGH